MSRFWPHGVPIGVACNDLATPIEFTWEGHKHAVVEIIDRWRVDEGWWHRRIWREYFQLTTRTGLLVLMYHDLRAAEWRLQRLYD
jgi:hypothetical protein